MDDKETKPTAVVVNDDPPQRNLLAGMLAEAAMEVRSFESAEAALRESTRRYRELFENSRDGFVVVDVQGRFLDANGAYCGMLGYSLEELRAKKDFYAVTPERWRQWEHEEIWCNRLLKTGASGVYEKEYLRKDGTVFAVELQSFGVRDDQGNVRYLWGIARDITERKRAEQGREDEATRRRILMEQSRDGIVILDQDGGVYESNQKFADMLGYSLAEMRDLHVFDWEYLYPKVAVVEMIRKVDEKGDHFETKHKRKDGSTYDVEISTNAALFAGQKLIFCVCRDITERKRAEEEARASHEKFYKAFGTNPASMALSTLEEGRFIDVNEAFTKTLGYSKEEIIGKTSGELNLFADSSQRAALVRMMHEKGSLKDLELAVCAKDGSVRYGLFSADAIHLRDRQLLLSVMVDITERRRAEEALQESERRYRLIAENTSDSIWAMGPDLRFTYLSPSSERLFGYTVEEWADLEWAEFVHPEDLPIVNALFERLATGHDGRSPATAIRVRRKGGEDMWVEFTASRIVGPDGDLAGFTGVTRDVTDRKQAEAERERLQAQLTQAQKMESVGRLAGGVAHDFNNMLGVILGHAEMALGRVGPNDRLRANLEEIRKAGQRSADLTRQLLAFARKQTVAPRVLALNDTIASMLKILRRLIGEDIDLVWVPGTDLWSVKMDPTQIDQVLANLCVNARDAISGVGRVTIATHNAVLDEEYCALHAGSVPGDYVLLTVRDDGCGMEAETLSHLFEPFFTTKETGKGTGLGLAMLYGVVKQNNGFVTVESAPGQGTTFMIYLPRHKGKAAQASVTLKAQVAVHGRETVLLVEDEPMTLEMTTMMLENLGYNVLAAGTPGEAIRLAGEHSGGIDLLMTDVVMPEMNGRDLAKNLLSMFPDMRRLFMSGYTANVIAHHGVLDEGVHFIQKPFLMKDLGAKIREALESG